MKIAGSLVRNVDFFASTCLVSSRWFGKLEEISDSNVSKQILMWFFVACVALCDIPTCLITSQKGQNLRSFARNPRFVCTTVCCLESLVFLWHRRVYGEAENISYSNVSKQVVMSFCVAGVALCDIPTCLMMFRKCQN